MLFLPGNTPNIIQNGDALLSDAVILDLEDAVAPDQKDAARILVRNALKYLDFSKVEVIVRINSVDTAFWKRDLDELMPLRPSLIMACVFLEIGQDVHIAGDLRAAVDAGVRKGYGEGYLRKSVVRDPLDRVNTGDNTPAMLYTELVPGDQVKITVAPKGFGSENMGFNRAFPPGTAPETTIAALKKDLGVKD